MRKITVFLCIVLIINLFSAFGSLAMTTVEPDVVAGQLHVAALNIYGRVQAGGDNSYGQSLTYGWKDIVSICAGKYFTAGLDKNGKVFVAGKCENGTLIDASGLENIIQIAAGDNFLAALDIDKKVYVLGNCGSIDVSQWTDIKKIACGKEHIVGLMENGKCVGSGKYAPSLVDSYSSVADIYAGADLTVLKKTDGSLHHEGMGVYSITSEEEGSSWRPSQWVIDSEGNPADIVKDIVISSGSGYTSIVTIVFNDGTVKTDATADNSELPDSFINKIKQLENVSKLDINYIKRGLDSEFFAVVMEKETNSIYTIGNATEDPEKWENEIKTFDVSVRPLEIVENDKLVVQGRKSLAFLLPDGSVKTIGDISLSGFVNLKNLTSTKQTGSGQVDYYFGINEEGKIITNFTGVDLSDWHGAVKVSSARWNNNDKLVTALRWDGRLSYSTDLDDNINFFDEKLGRIVDIDSGEFFTAGLTADKKVVLADTSGNGLNTSSWSNIEKIYAGYKHVLGVDTNGNYFVTGGPTEMKTIIDTWTGMVDFACGLDYTVGLDSNGRCHFAGTSTSAYNKLKTAVEAWTDIVKIYGGYNYVIGEKSNGTYVHANLTASTPDLSGIENVYYKDNDFLYQEKGGSKIVLDYCLENGRTAYMTFFDSSSNPVGYKKVTLEGNGERVAEEYTAMGAQSSKMTFNTPSVSELTSYFENEFKNNNISVSYCSDKEKTVYVTLYNKDSEPIGFKKITLPVSQTYTTVSVPCEEGTVSYKLAYDKPNAGDLGFYQENSITDGIISVNYCSDAEKTVYITVFNSENEAIESKKITLPVSQEFKMVTSECAEGAASYKIAFDKPLASKLSFYVEHGINSGNFEIDYCSVVEKQVYVTFFDGESNPVDYAKITLAAAEEFTEITYPVNENAAGYKLTFKEPLASELSFYMEHKLEGNKVLVDYCADADKEIFVVFYGSEGEQLAIEKIMLTESEQMASKQTGYTEGVVNYKIFFAPPTSNDIPFYMEHTLENGNLLINYCSAEEKTAYITLLDGEGRPVEFKKITLPASVQYIEKQYSCREEAESILISFNEVPLASELSFYAEHKKEDGKIKISYCSDTDRDVYITLFDRKGLPTEYKKVALQQSEEMTEVLIDCPEDYKLSFDTLKATDIGFYMEQKAEGGEVVINYCSDSDRKMWLAFYDLERNLADFKTVEFNVSEGKTELRFGCDAAERYRLLLWDSLKPVYGAEGILR